MSLQNELDQFNGSESFYRHWTGRIVYTEGVQYLAEKAGAHWLIDAIASYQMDKRIKNNPMLAEMQFWKLKVKDTKGVLTCVADAGCKPAITQEIEFTDFPLEEIELWVEGNTLYLPSER